MKYLVSILTLLLVSTIAQAQSSNAAAERLQATAKARKVHKEIVISYDKFKNRTIVTTKPYNLIGGGEQFAVAMADAMSRGPYSTGRGSGYPTSLHLMIGFTFKGEPEKIVPDEYILILASNSSNWVFLKGDKNLYFLLNDKDRIELEPVDDDYDINSRSVSERLAYKITKEQLRQIVGANLVELKLGNLPRKLKSEVGVRISYLLNLTD